MRRLGSRRAHVEVGSPLVAEERLGDLTAGTVVSGIGYVVAARGGAGVLAADFARADSGAPRRGCARPRA